MQGLSLQLPFPLGVCAAPSVPSAGGNDLGVCKLSASQCLYKCFYFINVRDSGAFPYVNLSFELGFHKEGKCDGMEPATGNY